MKKILIVLGTRPEAIKLAPVIKKLKEEKKFKTIVCSTGQHREMLKQVTDIFDIKIDDDLDLMKPNQTLFDITANSVINLKSTIDRYEPDLLMVQGDTTTAFISALAAFYEKIKIAHVEAGLRSYDLFHPYPEEANRRFISVIADLNFAPTESSKKNLLCEGFDPSKIFLTGNTVIDALLQIKEKIDEKTFADQIEKNIKHKFGSEIFNKKFILITLHRREKFGEEIKELLVTLRQLAERYSDYNFIYPVHLNPNVAEPVKEILSVTKNFILTEPMDYLNFLFMMSRCHFIMSDSGGIQEECFVFSKPIIVLRTVTERNEAVKAGYAFLTGSNSEKIKYHFEMVDSKLKDGHNFFLNENPFGDGKASERIVDYLKQKLLQ